MTEAALEALRKRAIVALADYASAARGADVTEERDRVLAEKWAELAVAAAVPPSSADDLEVQDPEPII